MRFTWATPLMGLVSALALFSPSPVGAAPIGFDTSVINFDPGFKGAAALAFAPDGTLYVVEGKEHNEVTNETSIHVIKPDGSFGTSISLIGDDDDDDIRVGGIAVHPITGDLYITDSAPGARTMYRVDPVTGIKTSFGGSLNLANIDDVSIRSTGEIFVSDALGLALGGGSIKMVEDGVGVNVTPVVDGLDFAAGLAFDSDGDLIYQQAFVTSFFPPVFASHGEVYRLDITDTVSGLVFGASTQLADNLAATFDLAVDSENDIFITGSGGLYELFPETVFDASPPPPQDFSSEVAFLAGTQAFEPFSGSDGGVLAYLPSFNSPTITLITPTGLSVVIPEPSGIVLGLLALAGWLSLANSTRRRRNRG